MDRLSELPDVLIHHIFSFLPMKYVVRTTILSQRWKDLWITVPCLSFIAESDELGKCRDMFSARWRGSKIQKLSIFLNLVPDLWLYSDQQSWVALAVHYKVEELDVFNLFDECTVSWLPQSLYSSSSIRKLRLYGCDIECHGNISWDQLNSLSIRNECVYQEVIDNVLLGSPQLEVFELSCDRNLDIRSTSLKKLFLHYDAEDYYSVALDEIDSEMHVYAPNLEVLRISGSLCVECLLLRVPSLIEATLDFYHPTFGVDEDLADYDYRGDMLWVIFWGINHVQKLEIGDWCIKVLAVMKKTNLPPPLLNLKCLTVDTRVGNSYLAGIVNLLDITPNVTMLTIKNSYIRRVDSDDDCDCHCHFQCLCDSDNECDCHCHCDADCYCHCHCDGDCGCHCHSDSNDDSEDDSDDEYDDDEGLGDESGNPEGSIKVEFSDSFLMNLRILKIELFMYDSAVFSLAKFVLKKASALEKIVVTTEIVESNDEDVLLREMHKLLKLRRSSPNAEVVLHRRPPRKVSSGFDYPWWSA